MLVQLFASVGLYRAIAISSVIALAVKITVGSYLANHYGVNGIALSTGIMYLINSAYFVWIFSRAEFPQGIKSGSIDKETE